MNKTFLRDELANVITALAVTTAERPGMSDEYERGFLSALRSVAIAFGVADAASKDSSRLE